MEKSLLWVKALNLKPEDLQIIESSCPDGEPLIHHGVISGQINNDSYILWAQQHYEMAVIDDEFFMQETTSHHIAEFMQKGEFTKNAVPVGHFDDVIIIACSDPNTVIDMPFKHLLLLASPFAIERIWNQIYIDNNDELEDVEPTNTKSEVALKTTVNPAIQIDHQVTNAPQVTPQKNTSHDMHSLSVAPVEQSEAPMADNVPEGLSLNTEIKHAAETESEDEAIEMPAMPEGLMLDPENIFPVDAKQEKTIEDSNDTLEEAKSELPAAPEGFVNTLPETPPMPKGLTTVPVAAIAKDGEQVGESETVVPIEVNAEPPEGDVSPDTASDEQPQVTLDGGIHVAAPGQLDEAKDLEEMLSWFCKELNTKYSSSLFLTLQQNQLQAWKWDNTWKVRPGAKDTISLEKPSLFKITFRTKKPFHGRLIQNPVHDIFFNDFVAAVSPEVVTAMPILNDDQLWGVIVCVGNEDVNTPEALTLVERVASQFENSLKTGDIKKSA